MDSEQRAPQAHKHVSSDVQPPLSMLSTPMDLPRAFGVHIKFILDLCCEEVLRWSNQANSSLRHWEALLYYEAPARTFIHNKFASLEYQAQGVTVFHTLDFCSHFDNVGMCIQTLNSLSEAFGIFWGSTWRRHAATLSLLWTGRHLGSWVKKRSLQCEHRLGNFHSKELTTILNQGRRT